MLCSEPVWCVTDRNIVGLEVATIPVETSSAANGCFVDIWIASFTKMDFQHNQQILKKTEINRSLLQTVF